MPTDNFTCLSNDRSGSPSGSGSKETPIFSASPLNTSIIIGATKFGRQLRTITGEFAGFGKGRRFVLANGQEWEQTESTSLNLRKQNPKVTIKPGLAGAWYLQVEGSNTMPKCAA